MPFGESHLLGKLLWISGGGAFKGEQPMGPMDWFDLLLHGLPWVFTFIGIVAFVVKWLSPAAKK